MINYKFKKYILRLFFLLILYYLFFFLMLKVSYLDIFDYGLEFPEKKIDLYWPFINHLILKYLIQLLLIFLIYKVTIEILFFHFINSKKILEFKGYLQIFEFSIRVSLIFLIGGVHIFCFTRAFFGLLTVIITYDFKNYSEIFSWIWNSFKSYKVQYLSFESCIFILRSLIHTSFLILYFYIILPYFIKKAKRFSLF